MNADWQRARENGELVRIDSVKIGTKVLTAYNGVVKVGRRAEVFGGVYVDGGLLFSGCAEVLVMKKEG